jgi:hypothetical protein
VGIAPRAWQEAALFCDGLHEGTLAFADAAALDRGVLRTGTRVLLASPVAVAAINGDRRREHALEQTEGAGQGQPGDRPAGRATILVSARHGDAGSRRVVVSLATHAYVSIGVEYSRSLCCQEDTTTLVF